uniref:Uncharacterized protein n=1 Tax=Cacopsylla melanoneura TaxID=428564 RepID=A0A8D9DUS6_9HEMI
MNAWYIVAYMQCAHLLPHMKWIVALTPPHWKQFYCNAMKLYSFPPPLPKNLYFILFFFLPFLYCQTHTRANEGYLQYLLPGTACAFVFARLPIYMLFKCCEKVPGEKH